MNLLTKIFLFGCFFIANQSLFSEDKIKECKILKNLGCGYKKHIENSVWIVPTSTLLAYEHLNNSQIPVSDQTVWIINEFNQGYFFGDSYTSLNGTPSSHREIVGSITPDGNVYIAFYPTSGDVENTDIVNGIGTFKKERGKYFFLMQMNSAENSLTGLSHWSYMIRVQPEDFFYQHLPGVNISVPEFISQF